MSEFEKWFDSEYSNFGRKASIFYDAEHDLYDSQFIDERYDAFKAGQKSKQSEIDQLKAEVENLKNPSLVLHTKKYREQCEAFESLSDAEKKAYSIGYEWACKVSQQQILTLIQDHESIEGRSDKEIEKLKAEKAGLEKRVDGALSQLESGSFVVNNLRKTLRGESFLEYLERTEQLAEKMPDSIKNSVREGLGMGRGEHE